MTENGGSCNNHAAENPLVTIAMIFAGITIVVGTAYCAGVHVATQLHNQHKRDIREFERKLRKEQRRKEREERHHERSDWFVAIFED